MSHAVISCPTGEISNGDAFAVELRGAAVKRQADEYVSEDESSICKYRKITTEEKILQAKSEDVASSPYVVSDDSLEENSNDERELPSNISNDDEYFGECNDEEPIVRNGQKMTLTEYKRMMDIESDSDGLVEEEAAHEKDFTNNEPSNVIDEKLDNSRDNIIIATMDNVDGENQLTESRREIGVHGSEPDDSADVNQISNGIQHPDDPSVISDTQIALAETQAFEVQENSNFEIKKSDSMRIDANNGPKVIVQEPINGEGYDENADASRSCSTEHLQPIPSTSGAVGEPITDASRVESASNMDLMNIVAGLRQDVQTLVQRIDKQEDILATVVAANEIYMTPLFAQDFNEKYGLKIPFAKLEDFDKFNQELVKSTRFCNEFIANLCNYIDNKVTLAKNILTMVRKYMSKDLATLFNASKPTSSKMVLKDTMFCKCLLQATKLTIRNGLLPLEHEKAFMKNLGLVVSGARGWPSPDENQKTQGQSQSQG
ncbi:hypothetical protein QAD02_018813 [Eretmocerus hayati]|uniref:Uncharacterized protein n=1 Tax=Eretmocerus hayati TaxID=131215 RepID=A0ACC2PJK6_9HYME|nr:hypothetical protein QAD02_018813 [Eretmocerus hayati]